MVDSKNTHSAATGQRTYIALEHLRRFLAFGKNMGIPVDFLLEHYGIDLERDTNKKGYVPGHIWEVIVVLGIEWCARLNEPLAGLAASQGLGNSFLGLWVFLSEKSQTLEGAMKVASQYQHLHTDTVTLEARFHPGYMDLIAKPRFKSIDACDHAADLYLSQCDMFMKHCTGEAHGITESVHFRHPAPKDPRQIDRYKALFNCPIYFDEPENFMRIHASALKLPLATADADVLAALREKANEKLEDFHANGGVDFQKTVTKHLKALFSSGHASKEALAERMGMNSRTLLRKLQQENITYRDLSHAVRLELAQQYLAQPSLPLASISILLGFQDPQSFSRWFTERTGTRPKTYRDQNIG